MTAMGDVRRQRIDELAARAGQVPEGEGGVSLVRSAFRRLRRNPVAILGAVLSVTFGIVGFLLFKVAPVLVVGWLVLKVVDRSRNRRRISAADQRWLDS